MLYIDLQYFPCVNALHALYTNKLVCFNAQLPFRRSTFRNRMVIPGANGLVSLTIPIIGGRDIKLPYKDVLIDHSVNWRRDHFRTITSIYGKSAWGINYFDSLEMLYAKKEKFLFDWNLICLEWICTKMKFKLEIVENSNVIDQNLIMNLTDTILPGNCSKGINPIKYFQVFEDRLGFQSNMSSIDLLMNEGSSGSLKFL